MKTTLIQPNKDLFDWYKSIGQMTTWKAYVGDEPYCYEKNMELWSTYYGKAGFFIEDSSLYYADIKLNAEVFMYFDDDFLYIHYIPMNGKLDHYEWVSDDEHYLSEHHHTAKWEHDLEKEKVYKVLEMLSKRNDALSQKLYKIAKDYIEKYDEEHGDWR